MEITVNNLDREKLDFVLAFYQNNIIYHRFLEYKETLDAGQQLTEKTIRDLFSFLNEEEINSQFFHFEEMIKYHVLYFSRDKKEITWITEPKVDKMLFQKKHPMKSGKYPMPKLLWKLYEDELYIYALKRTDVINDKTPIYTAPFLNVDLHGKVCMGNAHFKSDLIDYNKIIENVHYNFFNSVFTHTYYDKLLTINYVDFCDIYRNKKEFPDNILIKKTKTLKDIL